MYNRILTPKNCEGNYRDIRCRHKCNENNGKRLLGEMSRTRMHKFHRLADTA